MKGGGIGIRGDLTPEEAFSSFIENSTVTYDPSSQGTTSRVLKYNFTGEESPYIGIDRHTCNDPVNTILVKILFISREIRDMRLENSLGYDDDVFTTTTDNFNKEVGVQLDVFEKTHINGGLCPSIVYHEIKEKKKVLNIEENLDVLNLLSIGQPWVHELIGFHKDKFSSYGIIAMEFADDYSTIASLFDTIADENKKIILLAASFLIIQLFISTGYTQGDFSFNNFMFKNFPEGHVLTIDNVLDLKPIFIDFGKSKKVTRDYEKLTTFYINGHYKKLLRGICIIGNSDNTKMLLDNDEDGQYKWVSGYEKPTFTLNRNKPISEQMADKIAYQDEVARYNLNYENDEHQLFNEELPPELVDDSNKNFTQYIEKLTAIRGRTNNECITGGKYTKKRKRLIKPRTRRKRLRKRSRKI